MLLLFRRTLDFLGEAGPGGGNGSSTASESLAGGDTTGGVVWSPVDFAFFVLVLVVLLLAFAGSMLRRKAWANSLNRLPVATATFLCIGDIMAQEVATLVIVIG